MKISILNMCFAVSLIFTALKLFNIIDYSWIAIFSPLLLIAGFWSFIIGSIVLGTIGLITLVIYSEVTK